MAELKIVCSAEPDNIYKIDEMLGTLLENEYRGDYKKFAFAAHELIINSVDAMQSKGSNGNITISLTVNENFIKFEANDWAGGIPDSVIKSINSKKPDEMLEAESGRGLFLILNLIDEFEIRKEKDGSFTYSILSRVQNLVEEVQSL